MIRLQHMPLRLFIPAVLTVCLLPAILLLGAWHYRIEREALEDQYVVRAQHSLEDLHRLLQESRSRGHEEQLERTLSALGPLGDLAIALGADAHGRIFFSTLAAWKGRTLAEFESAFGLDLPVPPRKLAGLHPDGRRTLAYRPLASPASSSAAGGSLYLELDLERALAGYQQRISRHLATGIGLLALAALLLWWLLDRHIASPLSRLRQAALTSIHADRLSPLEERGSRELIETTRCFHRLHSELQQRLTILQHQRRLYAALSDTNQSILRAQDNKALLEAVTRVAVRAGFPLVWIGFVNDSGALRIATRAGVAKSWLENMQQQGWFEQDPLAQAVRSGQERLLRLQAGQTGEWERAAQAAGLAGGVALPLRRHQTHVGGLVVMGEDPDAFDDQTLALLREMAGDLAFGLENLERESARRRAELNLAQERALLRGLIDATPDLIFIKDHAYHYLGCNRAFEKLTGRSEEQILGSSDFDLFPDHLARFFRAHDVIIFKTGQSRRNEEWVEYADGRRVLLDTLKTPYHGPDGQVLGLIGICRDITELHGGVDAAPGEDAPATPNAHDAPAGETPRRKRVLVVETEIAIAAFYQQFLESQGLTAEVYTSSIEAMRRFEQSPDAFELLITDRVMPELNGAELIRRIKARRPRLPVILCTPDSKAPPPETENNLGIDRYLNKPLVLNELVTAIHQCLGREGAVPA